MQGIPRSQWKEWIADLALEGCKINTLDPLTASSDEFAAISSDLVLLDGQLPRISMILALLRTFRKDLQLVIVSELESSVIRCEIKRFTEVICISGPKDGVSFRATLEEILAAGRPGKTVRRSIRQPLPTAC